VPRSSGRRGHSRRKIPERCPIWCASSSRSERIRDFADESLLEEWRADPADLDTAGVLADRLEDEGHEHESGVLRAAVKRMVQMRLDKTNALRQGYC